MSLENHVFGDGQASPLGKGDNSQPSGRYRRKTVNPPEPRPTYNEWLRYINAQNEPHEPTQRD